MIERTGRVYESKEALEDLLIQWRDIRLLGGFSVVISVIIIFIAPLAGVLFFFGALLWTVFANKHFTNLRDDYIFLTRPRRDIRPPA